MQPQRNPGEPAARTRFDSGRPCLDLLATVGRRGADPIDRVPTPADVAAWLVDAGVLDRPAPVTEFDLTDTRRLRDAGYAVINAARNSRTPNRRAVAVVNEFAAHPTPQPRLAANGRAATRHSDRPVQAALAVLARDVIDLVTGPDLARVHACAETDCRMLFLDTSRGARRRWCSMARCGNRAKARAHATRTRRRERP
jgi:predicted RNA-binding Zn ribbon-like protein